MYIYPYIYQWFMCVNCLYTNIFGYTCRSHIVSIHHIHLIKIDIADDGNQWFNVARIWHNKKKYICYSRGSWGPILLLDHYFLGFVDAFFKDGLRVFFFGRVSQGSCAIPSPILSSHCEPSQVSSVSTDSCSLRIVSALLPRKLGLRQ